MSLTQTLFYIFSCWGVFICFGVNLERWINEFFKRQVGVDEKKEVIEEIHHTMAYFNF